MSLIGVQFRKGFRFQLPFHGEGRRDTNYVWFDVTLPWGVAARNPRLTAPPGLPAVGGATPPDPRESQY